MSLNLLIEFSNLDLPPKRRTLPRGTTYSATPDLAHPGRKIFIAPSETYKEHALLSYGNLSQKSLRKQTNLTKATRNITNTKTEGER